MIEFSAERDKIMAELLEVQKATGRIVADTENTFHHSRYLALSSLLEVVKPILSERQLVLLQGYGAAAERSIEVFSHIEHTPSGQWVRHTVPMPLIAPGPQSVASTFKYGRRTTLEPMVGISAAVDDDDAEVAMNRPAKAQKRPASDKTEPAATEDTTDAEARLRAGIGKADTIAKLDKFTMREDATRAYQSLDPIQRGLIDNMVTAKRAELSGAYPQTGEINPNRHSARAHIVAKDARFQTFVVETFGGDVTSEDTALRWLRARLNIAHLSALDKDEGADALAEFLDIDGQYQGWLRR